MSACDGKAFKIILVTFSHWTNEGLMDPEYLYWDDNEFMTCGNPAVDSRDDFDYPVGTTKESP